MYRLVLLSFLVFILTNATFSQSNQCGTDRASEILQSNDTNYFRRTQEVQNIVDNYLKYLKDNPNLKIGNADITIPVIVNIIYKNTDENLSDAIVQTQIDQLNTDYNRLNINNQSNIPASVLPIVGTPNIQFCLQQIKRASTTVTKFVLPDAGAAGGNTQLLSTIIPPTNQTTYLNFYIADIGSIGINGQTRDDIGGFTFLPSSTTNSIFMDYTRFGNPGVNGNIAGHVATHEVGHWLGLCHPWTVSGNCISGVPNMPTLHASAYLNCDDNAGTLPTHMNFMEYKWEDNCRTMFTSGQVLIMRAMLSAANPYSTPPNLVGPLNSMISGTNLDPNRCSFLPPIACPGTNVTINNIAVTTLSPTSVNIRWDRTPNAIGYTIQYKISTTTVWSSITVTNPNIILSGLIPPLPNSSIAYDYKVKPLFVSCDGTDNQSVFTIKDIDACNTFTFTPNEPNNLINQPLSYSNLIIPSNVTHTVTISDNLNNIGDEDWFRVKTNIGQNSLRVILVAPKILGIDYDLELYDCNGNFLRSSNNIPTSKLTATSTSGGTASIDVYFREYITINNIVPQSDFYIRIVDHGTSIHTAGCYSITVLENINDFVNY